jgi:hypothetical protein
VLTAPDSARIAPRWTTSSPDDTAGLRHGSSIRRRDDRSAAHLRWLRGRKRCGDCCHLRVDACADIDIDRVGGASSVANWLASNVAGM